MIRVLICRCMIVLLAGCGPREGSVRLTSTNSSTQLRYAKGFTVSELHGATLIEVTQPFQGATYGFKYLLVKRGKPVPAHDANVKVIEVPLETIACTSTTHIPLLDYLELSDRLIAFPTLDYISSERTRKRIDAGKVVDIGIDNSLNLELLAVAKPSLVMGYTLTGNIGQFKKIEELGIPVVINAEYLEEHPLGRAEWIKFMGLLFGKEEEANQVFEMIEKNYLGTQALIGSALKRPTVMSGVVYGDGWFLPGGQNHASIILKDAGCEYLWESDSTHGYLQLSFESVYEKAHGADLWIGVASFNSLEAIKLTDIRYTKFKAFQNKNVFTYDARKGAKGGSEFLELGNLRPDIILKDLVKIAHPELLPEYELYFHKRLE